MSRFLILFSAPESMSDFMAKLSPDERQAGMQAWSDWKTEADKTISFEFGAVVQAAGLIRAVDKDVLQDSSNQASNYAFAEAESKEVLAAALKTHPHMGRDGATIDILEVLSMPS